MSQPTPFVRGTSFTDFSTEHPQSQQPGAALDAELDGAKETLDGILANLELIQRDDGALANQTVGPDQLTDEAIALIGGDTAAATALAITARNDAEGFRDEAEGFRDGAEE